jgi:hypothetical protein
MNDNHAITAAVIPWEAGEWGVAIDLPYGKRITYSVGRSRMVAEIEGRRIAEGKPPVWGPWAGQDLEKGAGTPALVPIRQVGH